MKCANVRVLTVFVYVNQDADSPHAFIPSFHFISIVLLNIFFLSLTDQRDYIP